MMVTSAALATNRQPTRPRVAGAREAEILDGVVELLIEVGYDRLTFDLVATHVRASKATLYRKWDGKPDLVMSAVEHLFLRAHGPIGEFADTGSLLGDLEAAFCGSTEIEQLPGVLAAALPALQRDDELRELFANRFIGPKTAMLRKILERARARGEIAADADLDALAAVLPAMNFHRVLTTGECPNGEYSRHVIQAILLPACRGTTTSTS